MSSFSAQESKVWGLGKAPAPASLSCPSPFQPQCLPCSVSHTIRRLTAELFAYTRPWVSPHCSPSVGSVSPTMIANASKTEAASSSLPWIPYGYIKKLIILFIFFLKKRGRGLQITKAFTIASVFYRLFQVAGARKPNRASLINGAYCEDKQEAGSAAAYPARPHYELIRACYCLEQTCSSCSQAAALLT